MYKHAAAKRAAQELRAGGHLKISPFFGTKVNSAYKVTRLYRLVMVNSAYKVTGLYRLVIVK